MRARWILMSFTVAAMAAALACNDDTKPADPTCDPDTCMGMCLGIWGLAGFCEGTTCLCTWPDTGTDPETDADPDPTADTGDAIGDIPIEMPVDACTGTADQDIIGTTDVYGAAATCAMGCLSAPSMVTCVAPCLETSTGLTGDCAMCYGAAVQCSFESCLSECSLDPTGAACQACVAEAGCDAAFETCSGITG